jgi:hypothetical protein
MLRIQVVNGSIPARLTNKISGLDRTENDATALVATKID